MKRPAPARPSLRRRLLVFLLIPMATLLLLDALLSYGVALGYANRVHDRDLADDARTLAKLLQSNPLGGRLSRQARFLLEYDPDGRSYFSVRSSSQGLLAGDDRLAAPPTPPAEGVPALYDTRLDGHALRAATVREDMPGDAAGQLTVTVAETLHDRREQAREILLLAVVMQTLLIACVLSLVWFGVRRGLRVLDPLTARLAARSSELTPIDGPDVPQEIQPLTRTIDALFGRLRDMLALHDRFIADAAHQLRTPLAGLSLHADRALADPSPANQADALAHIQRLTRRAARTASQLLALTRAQAAPPEGGEQRLIDLARRVPEMVAQRVHEAIRAVEAVADAGADAYLPRLVPTYLALHALPPEASGDRDAYAKTVRDRVLPAIARAGLARYVDAYVDRGAFTVEQARAVLGRARDLGLGLRVHAGQLADLGAAELAAELGASSADHLEHVGPSGIEALARANVRAVLLPVASFTLGQAPPPVAALRTGGVRLVVASDANPGTAPTESLPLALALAVRSYGLSVAEALLGATREAAASLGLADTCGALRKGLRADLVLWDLPHEAAIVEPWGLPRTALVLRDGARMTA